MVCVRHSCLKAAHTNNNNKAARGDAACALGRLRGSGRDAAAGRGPPAARADLRQRPPGGRWERKRALGGEGAKKGERDEEARGSKSRPPEFDVPCRAAPRATATKPPAPPLPPAGAPPQAITGEAAEGWGSGSFEQQQPLAAHHHHHQFGITPATTTTSSGWGAAPAVRWQGPPAWGRGGAGDLAADHAGREGFAGTALNPFGLHAARPGNAVRGGGGGGTTLLHLPAHRGWAPRCPRAWLYGCRCLISPPRSHHCPAK